MTNIQRAAIGALGGLAAVFVKFLGQDYDTVVANASNLSPELLMSYKVGYGLLTPILMFLGALVAWMSEETNKMKLIALAVAAPAMITTWSGGHKNSITPHAGYFISSAYAQSVSKSTDAPPPIQSNSSEPPIWQVIQNGVGVFFGYGKEPTRYWVIVGSYKDQNEARNVAESLNKRDQTLNAWVGVKAPPNDYYPVIVGNYSVLSEARTIKERALATRLVKDAYLSPGARR